MAKLFVCPFCKYRTRRLSNLKYHYYLEHFEERRATHCCPICGQVFKGLLGFVQHCSRKRDEYHIVLYYLARRYRGSHSRRRLLNVGKYVAKLLSVEM